MFVILYNSFRDHHCLTGVPRVPTVCEAIHPLGPGLSPSNPTGIHLQGRSWPTASSHHQPFSLLVVPPALQRQRPHASSLLYPQHSSPPLAQSRRIRNLSGTNATSWRPSQRHNSGSERLPFLSFPSYASPVIAFITWCVNGGLFPLL